MRKIINKLWGGVCAELVFWRSCDSLKFLAIILSGLLFYALGIKVILPVAVIALSVLYLPAPRVLNSLFARITTQILVAFALLQLSAAMQQIIVPWSNFFAVAAFYALFSWLILLFYGGKKEKAQLFSTQDLAGLVIILMFMLPFGGIICGQDSAYKIVQIAGIQSPDAAHHFENINSRVYEQHLDTTGYPKGFHLSVGFLQDAFAGSQQDYSWQTNLFIYFSQYMIMGSLMAVAAFYLCFAWLKRLIKQMSLFASLCVAVAVGLPLCTLFLWPFVAHGFLNYYYTIASFLFGLVFINQYCLAKTKDYSNAMLFIGMIMLYGSSQSWPLVAPIAMAVLILFLWPNRIPKSDQIKKLFTSNPCLVFAAAIQPLPIITQVIFTKDSATYINSPGDLTVLHVFVLIGGLALVVALMLQKRATADLKKMLLNIFLPTGSFVALVIFMQQFLLGQAIYFSIKVALFTEVLLILLGVAVLFGIFMQSKVYKSVYLPLLAFVPMLTIILLVGAGPKPFDDLRGMFRDLSGAGKPAFYDQDAYQLTKLGKAGLINHSNATTLHYDANKKTIYAHAFLAQTILNIKYSRTAEGVKSERCHSEVFSNLAYGSYKKQEQQKLINDIKQCADLAKQAGVKFYIVTDNDSVEGIKSIIGEENLEYVSQ